ncbi:MAG: bifunctional oligoribonuclease/PAP phosphatase NrnA [Bacilli bacterium]|nr:bifunctional oligoribonuclease/PAP phosphatase NrnA [Bacilli bacterium]
MHNDIIKKILKKIRQYDVIVIARHVSPDPDAICSQLALRDAILSMYPKKKVYAVGKSVSKFRKFGVLDKVDVATLNKVLLITTDVPNFYRVDGIEGLGYSEVIKIDHHPFEEDFGGIEWIDESACSVCQMIAVMLLRSNFKFPESVASNLFLGIVSDSDRFLLPYTTPQTFQVCMELIRRYHLPFTRLYDKLYERSLEEVRFQGYIAQHLEVSENGFAHLEINDEIISDFHVDTATASNLINSFNYIKGIYVWTFVTYDSKNQFYKVNIRSKGPIVNEIASKYHGGGHKFASGVRTSSREEIDCLLRDLDEACKSYKSTLEM